MDHTERENQSLGAGGGTDSSAGRAPVRAIYVGHSAGNNLLSGSPGWSIVQSICQRQCAAKRWYALMRLCLLRSRAHGAAAESHTAFLGYEGGNGSNAAQVSHRIGERIESHSSGRRVLSLHTPMAMIAGQTSDQTTLDAVPDNRDAHPVNTQTNLKHRRARRRAPCASRSPRCANGYIT